MKTIGAAKLKGKALEVLDQLEPEETDITRRGIREELKLLLSRHNNQPVFNIREADFQAELCAQLRQRLDTDEGVEVNVDVKSSAPEQFCYSNLRTSRVHREMLVEGGVSDIVVFSARGPIVLECAHYGPTDVLKPARPSDVNAVIEIKASPSRCSNQRKACCQDLEKLNRIRLKHQHIETYLVIVDKSASTRSAKAPQLPPVQWWDKRETGIHPHGEPPLNRSFIEVWQLASDSNEVFEVKYWY